MRTKIAVVFCTIMLLSSNLAYAVLFVAEIIGNYQSIEIKRSGETQLLANFMEIKESDVISITSNKTSLTLLEDGRNAIKLDRSNTPYTVSNLNQSQSLWNKLVIFMQDRTAKMVKVDMRTRSFRPLPTQPIMILALNRYGDNWVTLQSSKLYIRWQGGKSPFAIRLLDEQNNILEEQSSYENEATLSNKNLQIGQRYRIEVSSPTSGQGKVQDDGYQWDQQFFTIVAADKIPLEIQQLNQLPLSTESIFRLKLAYQAVIPEWRFQALQEAVDNNIPELQQKILVSD